MAFYATNTLKPGRKGMWGTSVLRSPNLKRYRSKHLPRAEIERGKMTRRCCFMTWHPIHMPQYARQERENNQSLVLCRSSTCKTTSWRDRKEKPVRHWCCADRLPVKLPPGETGKRNQSGIGVVPIAYLWRYLKARQERETSQALVLNSSSTCKTTSWQDRKEKPVRHWCWTAHLPVKHNQTLGLNSSSSCKATSMRDRNEKLSGTGVLPPVYL